MKKVKLLILAIAVTPLIAGCESQRLAIMDQFIIDSAAKRSDRTESDVAGRKPAKPINLDTYVFKEHVYAYAEMDDETGILKRSPVKKGGKYTTAYAEANGFRQIAFRLNKQDDKNGGLDTSIQPKPDAESRKKLRNRLQLTIVERSNTICNYHKGAIIANKSLFDFTASALSSLLGTASGAVGGETAARILGTASGAVTATSAALNANVYQNLLATAIIRSIEATRAEFYRETIKPMREKSIDDYSVDQAIIDANDYHKLCSFYKGVVALAEGTEKKPLTREQIMAEIKALDALMKEQSDIIRNDGNKANDREIQDARFQWDAYSTRKKQLTALLLNPDTPGHFSDPEPGDNAADKDANDLTQAFPSLIEKWADNKPNSQEIKLLLTALRDPSDKLKGMDNALDDAKFDNGKAFRRLLGYVEEFQLLLGTVKADGYYGANTVTRVAEIMGGGANMITKEKLKELLDAAHAAGPSRDASTIVSYENWLTKEKEGKPFLKTIQSALKAKTTGKLDAQTRAKVNELRKQLKLPQNGRITSLLIRVLAADQKAPAS